jgi:molybdenum cofactor biosynthesis enzyme MoaA
MQYHVVVTERCAFCCTYCAGNSGVTLFIHRFMGDSFREETTLFAEEVIPSFNRA